MDHRRSGEADEVRTRSHFSSQIAMQESWAWHKADGEHEGAEA